MSKGKLISLVIVLIILALSVIYANPILLTKFSNPNVIIKLTRSGCYGDCPSYDVIIYRDGTVHWNGNYFVDVEGEAKGEVSVQQISELISAFEQVNFFFMKNYTSHDGTDAPTVVTTITINGRTKTVTHYYGDTSAPIELYELECRIDEIVNTNQWIGSKKVFCRDLINWISK